MPRVCHFTGKKTQFGHKVSHRGKAKYLGGVGTKVTGISRRQFKPNLQTVHATVGKTNKTLRVCTQCIRSGKIQRPQKKKPFAAINV